MFLLLLPLIAPVWTTFPKLTPSASAAVTSGNCYITGDSSTSLPGGGFAYSFTLNAPWTAENFTSNPPKPPYIHVERQSSATGKNTLTPPGGSMFNRQLRAEELSSKTANISTSITGPDSVGFFIALSIGPFTQAHDNYTTLRTCVVKAESATSPTPPPPPTTIPTPPPPAPPGGGGGGVSSSSCPIVKSVWGDLPGAGNKYSYDFTASTSWTTTIPVKYISIQKTASKTGNNKPANPAGWIVRNRGLTVDEKRDKTALFKHQLTGPDTATFKIVKSVVPINTDGSNNTAGLSPPEINNLSQPQSRICDIMTQKVNFPPPPAPPLDPSGGGGGTVPCSSITTQGASGSTSRTQQLNKSILTDSVWFEPDSQSSAGSTAARVTTNWGVTFPGSADVNALTKAINKWITNTEPASPLKGFGEFFVSKGKSYNVNPLLVLVIGEKETQLGLTGTGRVGQYNVGGMRGGSGFQVFANYQAGVEAMFKNLRSGLYLDPPSKLTNVYDIIMKWAPPYENDTETYIREINSWMKQVEGYYSDFAGNQQNTASQQNTNDCTVNTALAYAWPGLHSPAMEPKPAYKNAPPTGSDYSDCGVFVSTVMRRSGADPGYPASGTANQENHVRNSNKYSLVQLGPSNSLNDLKPGDILIVNVGSGEGGLGHTYIYLGSGKKASASLNGWAPRVDNNASLISSQGPYYLRARLK